jgi:hypothetical protein
MCVNRKYAMNVKLILVSFFAFLFSGCTLIRVLNVVNTKAITEKDYYYEIPFETRDNMILVKVNIRDHAYDFIFDTGAFTVLSDQITDNLKLIRIKGPRILDSQGNKESIYFTIPDTLSLGQLQLIKPGCGTFNFSSNQELSCFSFQGILGSNVLTHSVCQIDFTRQLLIIAHDIHKVTLPDQAKKIPFRKHITGQPIIDLKVDGISIRNVIVDYGSGSGFNLASGRLIKKIEKEHQAHATFKGYNAVGLFGKKENETYYYHSPDVRLEGVSVEDEMLIISKEGISTLGVEFLKNYQVTIDFINSFLYLSPVNGEEKEPLSTYGLTPVFSDGKLLVSGLFNPSPAQEAGIKVGDQILEVDGKDYSTVNPGEYCKILRYGIFSEEKDTVQIKLWTGGNDRMLTLVKKEILK